MSLTRLELAFPDGAPPGRLLVHGARATDDLSPLDLGRARIVQGQFADHAALRARGGDVVPHLPENEAPFDAALVFLPRAKAEARARVAEAAAHLPQGATLWVDGQKTEGIDSLLRELRALAPIDEVHSKAHGKIVRLRVPAPGWLPPEWNAAPTGAVPGFATAPGMFSADGIDPGSALLARHLPERLPTRIVDLGAGWGWLSAQALQRPGVETLHLVESDHAALDAARRNLPDPRAVFHWADARDFRLPEPVNAVIMNPPFHQGRKAEPSLGAAFIASAARLLTGAGRLWMVANRHLPYESVLAQHFASAVEIGGDTRFKVIEATGANRPARGPAGGGRR